MKYFLIWFQVEIGQNYIHQHERLVHAPNVDAAIEMIKRLYPSATGIRDATLYAY